MKSSQSIRLGFIGAGAITRSRHLPGFAKIPGIELTAVCNRSEASSQAVRRDWGFRRIAKTPGEVIQDKNVDAIVIGTWPYLHQPLACAALKAGKHVFTQARMARNLAEARQMLAASRRHSYLVSMICSSPYAMKCALWIQKLLQEGFIGKVRLVHFHQLNAAMADPQTPIHWRQQSRLNGINTLSFGIIMERFLQWFGPVEWVQAAGTIFTKRRKNERGQMMTVTNYDQLHVLSGLRDHPGSIHLSLSGALYHAPKDEIHIYGDRGTLFIDLATDEVTGARWNEKKVRKLPMPPSLRTDWTVEKDFIDAIRAGGRRHLSKKRTRFFAPNFEEGVRYMALTEATIQAARQGKRIRVTTR